jgi:hypothetical protein
MDTDTPKAPRRAKPKKERHTVYLPQPVHALVIEEAAKGSKTPSEVIAPIVEAHYRQQGRLP